MDSEAPKLVVKATNGTNRNKEGKTAIKVQIIASKPYIAARKLEETASISILYPFLV